MLSIIIPCFNEEEIISKSINKILFWCDSQEFECELLLVNNSSTDGTLDLMNSFQKEKNVVILNEELKGKGFAIKKGLLHCSFNKVVILDADLSTDIKELDKEWLEMEEVLIIGSRPLGNEFNTPKIRKLSGSILNFIIRKIFKLTFLDTQCGFKYISSKKIKEVSNKLSCGGFLYDLDLILFCLNSNIDVKEQPVDYYFDKNSSVSLLKDPFIMLKDILILRKKYKN